ncbi:MAG: UPF0182 family protein [Eubacteriales bacterium]|jgi:uncharacterized membrane protein (UPF0182 family)|nr:UPF0182 family protein [Bacillota bacterium]MBV1726845.1 UPF0182 family protein [Desulforudis sp.]MDQ7789044.1 UPF0182 family protein [Clostridia bacterium]MDZ4043058.1 UPF0182 family protein [Eubacteriales bacterium]MBV1736018.1 UPF0182 family protein [Desulforudis sp.]
MATGRVTLYLIIAAIAVIFMTVSGGARLFTDWLWFQSLGYDSVFIKIMVSDIGLRVTVGVAFFLFLLVNLLVTRKTVLEQGTISLQEGNVISMENVPWKDFLNKRVLTWVFLGASAVLAYMFSLSVAGDWIVLQKFLNPSQFGTVDPIFGRDIGFYVFTLPFQIFVFNILFWAGLITAFFVGVAYFLSNPVAGVGGLFAHPSSRIHMSVLLAFLLAVKSWGYVLQQYLLLYSDRGAVFGPGYTEINANMLALKVLLVISLLSAIVVLVTGFMRRGSGIALYAVGGLVLASILLNSVYPSVVQRFVVEPNELNRELPYIEHSIKFTREAYNLHNIERKPFPAGRTVDLADLEANQATVDNIRLWGGQPLRQTYSQLQEMRLYYEFKGIDVDRYIIDGEHRQVMLAARELEQNRLQDQAKTWVNQRLVFTHGYGVAMSPVNKVSGEGMPHFFIKDIPPVTDTDIVLDRPEIYYGEATDQYVIVNTHAQEFDYPEGEDNVYATYQEESGVKLGSIFKRVMFALALGDYKLLLSTDVTPDSQMLYYRNISERVQKIAPFLMMDEDPYIVINDGRLVWMWDAYTTTNMYPYSQPFQGRNNYIRNSVKVVVDAYNGETTFYVADDSDPIIQSLEKIFPEMFRPLDEMSESLRAHVRYPQDMFTIQANLYTLYHMQNPQVFYNREDKWEMPTEIFERDEQLMEPYYTIVQLPGEEETEFVLITPFTPTNKKNMIGWMAARSDGEHYGNLLVYEMPKQSLVYGPMQVEARINQDTTISQQLTLWENRGSRVIRGNLIIIPIKDSLLYVEPIYLQAEQSRMPELRRVIVAHGDRVVMEPTLEMALAAIFGTSDGRPVSPPGVDDPTTPVVTDPGVDVSIRDLIDEAVMHYNTAQDRMRSGDWTGYGQSLDSMKRTLDRLSAQTE